MGSSKTMIMVLGLLLNVAALCNGGITSSYRRLAEAAGDMPLNSDVFKMPPGNNPPHQVHLTQGDMEGRAVIVSWVTKKVGYRYVHYWKDNTTNKMSALGQYKTYKFYNYTSHYIHHCLVKNLEFNTKYYYELGNDPVRQFWFTTPPKPGPDVPYTFGLIGDLGQSFDSNSTLTHYENNPAKGKAVLNLGDLSYSDTYPFHDNARWDSWGQFVERSTACQPWIWTPGNHEIDYAPELNETSVFKPFVTRYPTPYAASGSNSPLWFSIKRASAYIIVLNSYSAYGKYTPQWYWFRAELANVNRTETPWLIVLMHCPWYNSNTYHYMEGETMRVQFEPWVVQYKVDVVVAGHVHSYERTERVSNIAYNITNGKSLPTGDLDAPVYIVIGDGGNKEGPSPNYTVPQPSYSAFREASFGHGIFDIKNRTHAYFSWHRNQDGYAVKADSMWFSNRFFRKVNDSTKA